MRYRVVDTDSGDYPNERFVTEAIAIEEATKVAREYNDKMDDNSPRYYMVVEEDYQLAPRFEP